MRIRENGALPVIVGLRLTLQDESKIESREAAAQSLALAGMQARVIRRALRRDEPEAKRYGFIPFLAITVDEAAFEALLTDPEVASIEEDALSAPQLSDTVPLIHGTELFKKFGHSGARQVVAILDSGVAKSHPMLAGKVVSEACYSTNNARLKQSSFCPGGVTRSTAKGSGVNCPATINGCAHGTHVASIAAGGPVGTLRGVASGAGIIAIKVMTKISNDTACGGPRKAPCIRNFESDAIAGLDRVYALRKKFKIAAVNMSFGGGSHVTACDSAVPAVAAAVDKLRSAGIMVIAASGNDSSDSGIISPACVSGAVAVAASSKADTTKQLEYYSKQANLNNLVKLAAPGVDVVAAVPSGTACATPGSPYCEFSGTSMAAPHVTAAYTVLKQAVPAASPDQIISALQCSGKMVEFTGDTAQPTRLAVPRIDLLGAYNWLKKIPTRSFKFDKAAQAFDWSPLILDWTVKDGKYSAAYSGTPASTLALSQIKGCSQYLDVSADLLRKNPTPSLNDYWGIGGVILNMQFDHQTRKYSGYLFYYYRYSSIITLQTYSTAGISRFDDGVGTSVCNVVSGAPIRDQEVNKIRAVSDADKLTFFLNGTQICSGPNDGTYQTGAVALYTEFASNRPANGGTFEVDNVIIKSLFESGARPAAATTTSGPSLAASGDTILIGSGRAPD